MLNFFSRDAFGLGACIIFVFLLVVTSQAMAGTCDVPTDILDCAVGTKGCPTIAACVDCCVNFAPRHQCRISCAKVAAGDDDDDDGVGLAITSVEPDLDQGTPSCPKTRTTPKRSSRSDLGAKTGPLRIECPCGTTRMRGQSVVPRLIYSILPTQPVKSATKAFLCRSTVVVLEHSAQSLAAPDLTSPSNHSP